jgi:uncharacterized membrane protein
MVDARFSPESAVVCDAGHTFRAAAGGDSRQAGEMGVARDSSEASWWRQTRWLAAAILGSGTALALIALTVAGDANGPLLFGLPPGAFFALLAAPLLIASAAFVFAGRQQALDRFYDVAED